eukprot:1154411-Prorocentrum_minimum.AAC.2
MHQTAARSHKDTRMHTGVKFMATGYHLLSTSQPEVSSTTTVRLVPHHKTNIKLKGFTTAWLARLAAD